MAEDGNAGLVCINICDQTNTTCIPSCYPLDPTFLSPPPPPPRVSSSQSHLAPFLIATVCILGISFLLLTTCTIILRSRFTRRRTRIGNDNNDPSTTRRGGGESFNRRDRGVVDHPIWHIATVGLDQAVIDAISVYEFRKIDKLLVAENGCTVCLGEFEEGEELRLLPKCNHAFHVSCVDMWLRSHKNCPLCRALVVSETGSSPAALPPIEDGGLEEERESGESSSRGLGEWPSEGTRIGRILRKNRGLRILSDLGENYRFRGTDGDEVGSIRRSFSFNLMSNCGGISKGNEGCSSNGNGDVDGRLVGVKEEEEKVDLEKGSRRGLSMSGLLIKSSSIGRSLQKGPVSMKRSISSSGKLFSFRRTKSQASILPL